MRSDFLRDYVRNSPPGFWLGIFVIAAATFYLPRPVAAAEPCSVAVAWQSGAITQYHCSERLSESQAVNYLAAQPGVAVAAPVRAYALALVPNDLDYKYQEPYLKKIQAPQAWDRPAIGDLRPVIAVLDSGVDTKHPDLAPNIWVNPWELPNDGIDNDRNGYPDDVNGWDFVASNPDPRPKFDEGWSEVAMNHGTIVAGVAAARGNNALGVAGIAWRAQIMSVRVLNGRGVGDTVTVARGIQFAVQNHADIINLSFVGSVSDPVLEDAIERAYRAGVLVVAAAGNEQQVGVDMNRQPQYPVCDDGFNGENRVIGVAALEDNDVRAVFSNYGSRCIDISAPGVKVYGTQLVDASKSDFKNAYGGYWAGTSVAAPMVSGALALLKAAYPRLSPSQIRDVLISSGDSLDGFNPLTPGGLGKRLNIASALDLAGSSPRFPVKSPLLLAPQQGALANVGTYDVSGELLSTFLAYHPRYERGVNVAAGDVDRDGETEIVTVPRQGGGPHVRIFNSRGELEFQFMAFPESYRGGLSLAVADFTGDGKDDIAVGTGKGVGAVVRIFDSAGMQRYQVVPYDINYVDGINVAAGDIDGDNVPELVVAPASATKLPVRVFLPTGEKKLEFTPYTTVFRGGVNVAVGDVDGDDRGDIVVVPGQGGAPQVKVYNNRGKSYLQFMSYSQSFRGGVNLAVGDVDGDGNNEIVTAPGASGGPHVRVFTKKGEVRSSFFVEPKTFRGGLTVAVFR